MLFDCVRVATPSPDFFLAIFDPVFYTSRELVISTAVYNTQPNQAKPSQTIK